MGLNGHSHPIRQTFCSALLLRLHKMSAPLLDDPEFLGFVGEVQITFSVRGVALVVVDIADIASPIRTQGFGNLSSGPVTGESVFCIASNTKPFIAVALGILVEEGRLNWTSKVKDILPDLKFTRDDAQHTITVADMLSHQTGLKGCANRLRFVGS